MFFSTRGDTPVLGQSTAKANHPPFKVCRSGLVSLVPIAAKDIYGKENVTVMRLIVVFLLHVCRLEESLKHLDSDHTGSTLFDSGCEILSRIQLAHTLLKLKMHEDALQHITNALESLTSLSLAVQERYSMTYS